MIQDTDEQIESRSAYAITQEHQIDRTVHELMCIYQLYKEEKITEPEVIARYSLQFFDDNNISMFTTYSFEIILSHDIHRKGQVWDLTDEKRTRAFVEYKLHDQINKTYEEFGELGYLRLKYIY